MLSKEEIEKAKKKLNDLKENVALFSTGWKSILKDREKQAIETLLQYIAQLEQENKALKKGQASLMSSRKKWKDRYYKLRKMFNKQSKIIDEMAEYIVELIKFNNPEELRETKEIKQYFEKKVEEE